MLHHFTNAVLNEANSFIKSKLRSDDKEQAVVLSMLNNTHEKSKSHPKIIMRLVDIASVELHSNPNEYVFQDTYFAIKKQPETFYMYFLFSTDYTDTNLMKNLELLSYIAEFFHNKPFFDGQNTPALQAIGIENFSIELVTLTSIEKNMLWQNLDMPYRPSLLYKVGFVFIGGSYKGSNIVPVIDNKK